MLFTQNSFDKKEKLLSELYSDLKNISLSPNNVDEAIQLFKDRATWIFKALFTDSKELVTRINDIHFKPLVWGYEDEDQEIFYENQALEQGLQQAHIVLRSATEKLKFARMLSETEIELKSKETSNGKDTHKETNKKSPTTIENKKVFIVHGHDENLKSEVALFIERQGLESVILHQQASGGKTIIEKLEERSDVGFAIVLYTPCDVGRLSTARRNNPRARQNVVFEHGFFIGKIGRGKVVALVKDGTEIPNDYSGVVYVNHNESGAWKTEIGRELAHVGYSIDFMKF